jgi:hypothetical protein
MWRKLFARARFEIVAEAGRPLEPNSTEWRFLPENRQRPGIIRLPAATRCERMHFGINHGIMDVYSNV